MVAYELFPSSDCGAVRFPNLSHLDISGLQRNLWVKMTRKSPGLMENDAGMEIHKERGFPHQLGKVPLKSGVTFPHFPQALPRFIAPNF